MRRIEIKEVGIKSAFKITLYIASVPLAIMMFIGILALIIGAAIGNSNMVGFGIMYIIMPAFMILIYGLMSMLITLVYNKFSKTFGGLELVIAEKKVITENTTHQPYE